MNTDLLKKHVKNYLAWIKANPLEHEKNMRERRERVAFYQSWTAERLRRMTEEELFEYVAKLWAMLIWGNKQYVVDKLIADNGLTELRNELGELAWGHACWRSPKTDPG